MQSQQKLRASCDACANSKVKCDKERPYCRRCISGGITCVYGISRKHGQRIRRRQQNGDRSRPSIAPNYAVATSPSFRRDLFTPDLNLSFDDLLQDPSIPFEDLNGRAVDEQDMFLFVESNTRLPELGWTDTSSSSSANRTPASMNQSLNTSSNNEENPTYRTHSINKEMTPLSSCKGRQSHFDLTQVASSIQLPPSLSTSASSQSANPANQQHSCYNRAITTLDHLRLEVHFSCASSHKPKSPEHRLGLPMLTLDHILQANKAALPTVQQLTSCPCSNKDSHLVFLYASIISKIIFWYRVAGRIIGAATAQIPNNSSSYTSSTLTDTDEDVNYTQTNDVQQGESIDSSLNDVTPSPAAYLPFTIGTFELEATDRAVLSCELLLSELRKITRLLDHFQMERMDSIEEQEEEIDERNIRERNFNAVGIEERNGGRKAQMGGIYPMLGTWLKRELQKTFQSVYSQRMARMEK